MSAYNNNLPNYNDFNSLAVYTDSVVANNPTMVTGPLQQITNMFNNRLQFESDGATRLICPKKNLVIDINTKVKLSNDKSRFEDYITGSPYTTGIFISFMEVIPLDIYNVDNKLMMYLHISDLTPRFIDMIINKPDLSEYQMKEIAIESCKRKERSSYIDNYENTDEGFNAYIKRVPKSKIEYEKAKVKWSKLMVAFDKKDQFVDYINKMQSETKSEHIPGTIPTGANNFPFEINTLQGFYDYILKTPISAINKKTIKHFYPSVSDEYTHIKDVGPAFKKAIKTLHDTLKAEAPVKK